MPKQKFSQKKFNISNPKVLIPVLFVLAFGLFGVYKMISSSAATPSTTIVTNYDYRNVFQAPQAPVDDVLTFTTHPIKVSPLQAGQTLNYTTISSTQGPGPTVLNTRACYTMRITSDKDAWVKIYGLNGSTRTVNVRQTPSSLSNSWGSRWQKYCISKPYSDGIDGRYAVQHISGGPINVYSLDKEVTYSY